MARAYLDLVQETEIAARMGEQDALCNLGIIYATGKGVDVDFITAHKWFNLAAMRGSQEAREQRAELAREMTPAQVAEAQRMAREWLETTHQ